MFGHVDIFDKSILYFIKKTIYTPVIGTEECKSTSQMAC